MLAAELNEKMSLSLRTVPCLRSFQLWLESLDIAIILIEALCIEIILHWCCIISVVAYSRVSFFIPQAHIFVFIFCNEAKVINLADGSLMALKQDLINIKTDIDTFWFCETHIAQRVPSIKGVPDRAVFKVIVIWIYFHDRVINQSQDGKCYDHYQ